MGRYLGGSHERMATSSDSVASASASASDAIVRFQALLLWWPGRREG
ncbi:hypothetical protein [uncultured Parolsenella sp.]|nr:hypothetical protein [uncultured Parolsenella sp.]